MKEHPADEWPTRWLWHNRKDQSIEIQIIDLLHDIRMLLFFIAILIVLN